MAFLEGMMMKKIWIVLMCTLCLTGCSVVQTMETIADDLAFAEAEAAQVELAVPENSELQLLSENGDDKLYLCGDYTIAVQTFCGGDLNRTVQTVTGFEKNSLMLMQTQRNGITTYSCAWSAAGEGVDQVCRAIILDDGEYHYAVTVMADYTQAAELRETWQQMLDSVTLSIG